MRLFQYQHNCSMPLPPDCIAQPQPFQQPQPDPCVPPFITPGTSGCYYIETTAVNFAGATSLCSDQGGRLVEIDSQEKQDEIFQYLDTNPSFRTAIFWFGATDVAVEGSWVWTTSGRPVTFTNWLVGQPHLLADQPDNYNGIDDCIGMFRVDQGLGKWVDWLCADTLKAICEIGEDRFPLSS